MYLSKFNHLLHFPAGKRRGKFCVSRQAESEAKVAATEQARDPVDEVTPEIGGDFSKGYFSPDKCSKKMWKDAGFFCSENS